MSGDLVERLLAEAEEAMSRVYFDGWRNAARWAERDDLVSDEGSYAYERDRDPCIESALAKLREAASALRSSGEAVGFVDSSRIHELREGRLNLALWAEIGGNADTPLYLHPATPASAWRPEPVERGWHWHFDGDVMRMEFVFPRPGLTYLVVQDDAHPVTGKRFTGKRYFRVAGAIGGQWYGPLPCPTPPASTKGG